MELSDHWVGLGLRVFTLPVDIWELREALNEQIKHEFYRRWLEIPFPQLQLHRHQTQSLHERQAGP
jgi:small-conductance mechanosensitive channel